MVLQNLCTRFERGRLTALIGRNGIGKSTLLKTLALFLAPLSGRLLLMNRPASDYTDQERARLISVVLTGRPQVQNMTVGELVALGRSPYTDFWGRLRRRDQQVVEDAIRSVGIEGLQDRMTHTLSDGEFQKVMIAKALAQQTPVILLDEPTAFLDYPSKVEVFKLLNRLAHEQQKTIILSTHDLELAIRLSDDILECTEKGVEKVTAESVSAQIAQLID